jgi:Mg-chelatase subunit ChlD
MASRLRRRITAAAIAAVMLMPMAGASPALATFDCKDVHVVWARGAMLGAGGLDFNGFYANALKDRILAPITQSAFELGSTGYGGYKYQPVQDWTQLLGAGFGGSAEYDSSIASGRDELVHYLTDRAAGCPNERYVLGGFSEGSQVTGEALFELPQTVRDRIAFVALFGDPKLDAGNWPPPVDPFTFACNGDKQPWHRGTAPCYIAGGAFGPRVPYLPSDIEQRVGSWCRQGDGACTGSLLDILAVANPLGDGGEHMNYFDDNADAAFAAREAAFRLKTYFAGQATAFDTSYDQFVSGQAGADLAIVFDTTGSMSGAIDNAKSQATELAQQWTTLFQNGRVGLVDFKDQGDPYVARVDLGLTNDANAFQTAVNALSASGGGDTPEAQLSGIMTALDGLSWTNGATKAAVVITDAPGKDPEPITNYTRASVSQHALEIDPVAIYGVDVANDSTVSGWMSPLASATAGEVVTLQSGQSLSDALSDLFDSVHANPIAKLDSPVVTRTGTAANFDASNSFDAASTITSYAWDFDGNGTVDRTTTTPTTSYTYPSTFHGTASVRVTASDGRSAIATADVIVDSIGLGSLQPIAPASASATATGPSQVTVTWTPAASDRADGYKVLAPDHTVLGIKVASDPHQIVINDVDLSQAIRLNVVASNAYGDSTMRQTGVVGGGTDVTPPVSRAGPLAATYTGATVSIPVTASDQGGSGVASIDIWARYRRDEAQNWGAWARAVTAPSGPVTYSFSSGDGDYEFYSIAIDGAGNREAAPAVADAATLRDAVDDPADFSVTFNVTNFPSNQSFLITLDATGVAADDRTTVTVSWDMYGVASNGHRTRLFAFVNATPTDGAFNSRVEGFSLHDQRASSSYASYSVDIKVTTGATSVTRTFSVPIPPPGTG